MPNSIINFSYNWNGKLFCKCFTTIRLKNDHKYQVGSSYELHLKDKPIGTGIIANIYYFKLNQLTDAMAMIDSGYPAEESKQMILKMYSNKNIKWDTQFLSFILIDFKHKATSQPPEWWLYDNYRPEPNAQ